MGKHLAPTAHGNKAPMWRTHVALSAVLMLIVVVATIVGFRWLTSEHTAASDPTVAVNDADTPSATPTGTETPATTAPLGEPTVVHVAGAVQTPGIVELDAGARVIDAIKGAGGPTEDARIDALNLAAVVTDGAYILVPDAQDTEPALPDTFGSAGSSDGGPGGPALVNLNTADATELETLPGIGPATSAEIIAHRDQHGPFQDLDDIEAVSGIGPATRERLEGLVSW